MSVFMLKRLYIRAICKNGFFCYNNRVTKFFSGKGDEGRTHFGKISLPKDDLVFEALGNLDELNSVIGWCRAKSRKKIGGILKNIQKDLFIIQGEIASAKFKFPVAQKIKNSHISSLEAIISEIGHKLPEIKNFVIPGSNEFSACLDVARTVTRRAERSIVRLKRGISPDIVAYLNRLSSLLFVLARYANHKLKIKEDRP